MKLIDKLYVKRTNASTVNSSWLHYFVPTTHTSFIHLFFINHPFYKLPMRSIKLNNTLALFFIFILQVFSANAQNIQNTTIIKSAKFADTDPIASFTIASTSTCVGDSIAFINTSKTVGGTNISNVHWYFGDNTDTREQNPAHKYLTAGTYSIILVAFNTIAGITYSDSVTQQITISPKPNITFTLTGTGTNTSNDSVFTQGGGLEISVNENYPTYVWTPNGELTKAINVSTSGTFSVLVIDSNGCKARKSKQVIVRPLIAGDSATILISNNILTPNNDGINDFLMIENLQDYTNPIEIYIYNVWGDMVYSNPNYQNDWGGFNNGKELDSGTYYYVITSKDKKGKIGFIDILR